VNEFAHSGRATTAPYAETAEARDRPDPDERIVAEAIAGAPARTMLEAIARIEVAARIQVFARIDEGSAGLLLQCCACP
jgi:hypothetical protein